LRFVIFRDVAVIALSSGERICAAGTGLHAGRAVELSVRPEAIDVRHANGRAADDPSALGGRVEQVAYLGGTVRYIVRTTGGLSVSAVAPKTADRHAVGSAVDLVWPAREALVLAGPADARQEEAEA